MSISSENSSAESARQVHEEPEPVKGPPRNIVTGMIKALRPRQWVKNVLVFAAPVAALGDDRYAYDYREVLVKVLIAFVVFSLAASAVYLINDARDVEADRQHPTKRYRPIAAGVVPEWLAYTMAVVLGAASLALAWTVTPNLALVIAIYIAIQLAYCFGLKHQPVIDICIVSSGFLIRAIAGGVAAEVPLSQWFLLMFAFGSLFMAAGKRYAELQLAERTGAKIRKSLESYTEFVSAFRVDVVGDRRWCCATACGRSSVTTRAAPPGSWCRSSRSRSRSCATPSTSTAEWPVSPRRSH